MWAPQCRPARVGQRTRNNLALARVFLYRIGFEEIKTGSNNKLTARPHVYPPLAGVGRNKQHNRCGVFMLVAELNFSVHPLDWNVCYRAFSAVLSIVKVSTRKTADRDHRNGGP